ncbi:MAG: zinc ribbon domain-containing protein [Promethearchaeota archaeon]|jgi:hypothetical protein
MPLCTNCGENIEENQQVCAKCGISLAGTEEKKPSKRFFVPIDYSDVKAIIPVGEEIIYSAVFNVSHPAPNTPYPEQIKTHVLFTPKGIAYQLGAMKKNEYLPWNKLAFLFFGGMMVKKGLKVYNFAFHTNSKYETPEESEMRPWKFYFEFAPHLISEKKKAGNSYNLKKIEKMFFKFVQVLGEEEIEFIRDNNDYEEFKKHSPRLKDASLKAVPKWLRPIVRRLDSSPIV